MTFNEHSLLKGKHSFLSPSNYHWLRYTDERLLEVYENYKAIERGTELHELAAKCISLGIRLERSPETLNQYVNDAINYQMRPEQILYYSPFCFGTADAISFRNNKLRIHDLKTGKTPANMDQLMIYAAIFCLEYTVDPDKIYIELRIYQNNDQQVYCPQKGEVRDVCDKITSANSLLERNYGLQRLEESSKSGQKKDKSKK